MYAYSCIYIIIRGQGYTRIPLYSSRFFCILANGASNYPAWSTRFVGARHKVHKGIMSHLSMEFNYELKEGH